MGKQTRCRSPARSRMPQSREDLKRSRLLSPAAAPTCGHAFCAGGPCNLLANQQQCFEVAVENPVKRKLQLPVKADKP